jgi:hypothetical protein
LELNEILFMQLRLFHQFCTEQHLNAAAADAIWTECGVWAYIQDNYGYLHTNGDAHILSGITADLRAMGKLEQQPEVRA